VKFLVTWRNSKHVIVLAIRVDASNEEDAKEKAYEKLDTLFQPTQMLNWSIQGVKQL
jgi:hypothetical protein